jgi:FkbM family methyltransferase
MRLRPGRNVLNLGAGSGFIACLCARVAGADRVTTVEANPALLPVIRPNLDRNGVGAATLLHGAVGATGEDTAPVAFEAAQPFWAGRLADAATGARAITVPRLGLRDLLARTRPALVIMDIEGGGEAALFDARWPAHVRHVIIKLRLDKNPDTVIQRIVDCLSASRMTHDPGPSRGRILCFQRVRGQRAVRSGAAERRVHGLRRARRPT